MGRGGEWKGALDDAFEINNGMIILRKAISEKNFAKDAKTL